MDHKKVFSDWKARIETGEEFQDSDSTRDALEGMNDASAKAETSLSMLCKLAAESEKLQETLLRKVYGQEHAVSSFVTGYFQAELLKTTDSSIRKPAATFLFVGAPGVGKTYLAETVAEVLKLPFARFDMSEYSDKDAVMEFAGSDGVYKGSKEGNVTGFVKNNPECVLIFDEIEKAHLNVLHLFLQILDAGRLRDSCTDKEICFDQTMIILTTNAGYSIYDDVRNTCLDKIPKRAVIQTLRTECDPRTGNPFFPPALCSRFASGNVILFNRMEPQYLKQILKYHLNRWVTNLEEKFNVEIQLDKYVSTALMLAEGGTADARMISGRAEKFLSKEIFELFRQMASASSNERLNKMKKISFRVDLDLDKVPSEIKELFLTADDHQKAMKRLARDHQVLQYDTYQRISKDGVTAEVILKDFKLRYAVEGVDSGRILGEAERPSVTFGDIIGAEEAKEELKFFVEYMKHPNQYSAKGFSPPKGVLLYGVPGTGKTMLAKAMAAEAKMTFMSAEGSQFLKKYVGEGPELVHALFRTARKYAPTILFIDEIDAIGKNRQNRDADSARSDTLNALLTEMSGFGTSEENQVFVLAATNFDVNGKDKHSLDPALLRRFDRKILVDLPNKEERFRFLKQRKNQSPVLAFSDREADRIAAGSGGMTLAKIKLILSFSMRCAVEKKSEFVTDEILEEAFASYDDGTDTNSLCTKDELRRIAIHEAGHAFVCWKNNHIPAYLTIMGNKSYGGYMMQEHGCGAFNLTRQQVHERIQEALAGRAAEIVIYGEEDGVSSGAANDLNVATQLAEKMIGQWGMDREFGMAVIHERNGLYSDLTHELHDRVNAILNQMLDETISKVGENKGEIKLLADMLMQKNHLNSQDIREVLESKSRMDAR